LFGFFSISHTSERQKEDLCLEENVEPVPVITYGNQGNSIIPNLEDQGGFWEANLH